MKTTTALILAAALAACVPPLGTTATSPTLPDPGTGTTAAPADDTSTGTSTGDEDTTAAASTGTTGADDTSTTGPGLVSVAAEPSTTTGADASSTGDGTTGDGTTGEPPEVALCFGDACDGDAPACPKGLVCKHDPETWIATCASPGPCVIGEPCQIEAGLCGFPPLTECRTDLDDQVNRCFALTCEEDADCPVGVCADERCYLL